MTEKTHENCKWFRLDRHTGSERLCAKGYRPEKIVDMFGETVEYCKDWDADFDFERPCTRCTYEGDEGACHHEAAVKLGFAVFRRNLHLDEMRLESWGTCTKAGLLFQRKGE